MRSTTPNETIARLDRDAAALGVELTHVSLNVRRFNVHPHRQLCYRPGGKGVIHVAAYVDGVLEAETVASIDRMRALLAVGSRAKLAVVDIPATIMPDGSQDHPHRKDHDEADDD